MDLRIAGSVSPGSLLDLVRTESGWVVRTADGDIPVEGATRPLDQLGLDHYKVRVGKDGGLHVVRYAYLHCHSDNSLLDGLTRVPHLVEHAEYAAALTDHGNMYGYCEFWKSMTAAGKHPIIGVEAYTDDLDGKLANRHLILLAENETGYHNLLKLVSDSYDHFHRHPHITMEMLRERHEGIIATTACVGGLAQRYATEGRFDLAEEAIKRYISIFGKENFYLEVQRHKLPQEGIVESFFMDMAAQYGLKIIATTDAHYPTASDAYAHEILLCMQRSATITGKHWRFEGEGYYLLTSEEMEALFADHPEWLDNTLELAERCNVKLELGHVTLPDYDIPAPFADANSYFEHLCRKGFQDRFAGTDKLTNKEYTERWNYEMAMIKKMGFAGYFLVVWDCINWARSHNIYVGPGRGSAAGSLLAYCCGITDIDPLEYGLLFERFLNPERVSMPDWICVSTL